MAVVPTPWLLGGVVTAALLVVWSGIRLTRYGDALGEQYELSRTWVGVILLAMITSLPELVVTLSAQLAVARPRTAMGNVCGSNLINLCIFAVMDIYEGPGALSGRLGRGLLKPAKMGLICMGVAVLGLSMSHVGWAHWTGVWPWLISGALLCVCLYSMWRTERKDELPVQAPAAGPARRNAGIVARFGAFAAVLLFSGVVLILLCDSLVQRELHIGGTSFRLDETVLAVIGLAFVTSLPELVVCLAAVRMGAFDMAVGNLLGSNIFNIMLLPLAHFVRPTRPFWTEALPVHWLTLCGAMVLTCIIMAGIRRRSKWAALRVGWDGALVAVLGGTGLLLVTLLRQLR